MENRQTSTDQKLKGFFNSSSCEYIFRFVVPFKWTTLCYITQSCVNYSPMICSTCWRQWIQNFQCDLGVKSITISLSVRLCNLCQLLNNRKILKIWEIPLSCLFTISWSKREELGRQAVGQNTTGMKKVWTSAQFTTTDPWGNSERPDGAVATLKCLHTPAHLAFASSRKESKFISWLMVGRLFSFNGRMRKSLNHTESLQAPSAAAIKVTPRGKCRLQKPVRQGETT